MNARRIVVVLLASTVGSLSAQNTASISKHLETARSDMRANALEAAISELGQVIALDPNNAEAHLDLGSIAFLRGNYASAEPELRLAAKLAPNQKRTKALLAISEKHLNRATAQADLETSFNDDIDVKLRRQVGTELADFYYQRRQLDNTAGVMRTLVTLDPDNVDILFFAQRVYSELADATLNKLAVLAPDSARIEQLIAERLINAGDAQDAVIHYRKALTRDANLPGVHFELAEAIMQSSANNPAALKEAESELTAAAKLDGDSPQVEDELGQLSLQNSDSTAAMEHFNHAYTLNPGDVGAAMGMAGVLKSNGKPQEALTYLRQAVKEDPMSVEGHYQLAQVCRELKLTDEAKQEFTLYHEVKEAKDKSRGLMREMNPKSTGQAEATAQANQK